MLLHGQRIHGPQLVQLLPQLLVLDAQCICIQVQRFESFQQLDDRLPPLGLETLANVLPACLELRVTELGLMQLLRHQYCLPTHQLQRLVTGSQRQVGGTQSLLGLDQSRVQLRQRMLSLLQLHRQRRNLLGECQVGVRQLRQLATQRLQSCRGRRLFLHETRRAILGYLHTRL